MLARDAVGPTVAAANDPVASHVPPIMSMTATAPRLGHIAPRERAGAQTGRTYEYQYERTARAALELLTDSTKHICVYCACTTTT